MMDRPAINPADCPSVGSGMVANLWATIRASISRLAVYVRRGVFREITQAQILVVTILVANGTACKAAWDKVDNTADTAAAINAIFRVCQPLVTDSDTKSAIKLMDRLISKADYAYNKHRTESWRQWIMEAVKNGAGKAHRFANAPNRPPTIVASKYTSIPNQIMDEQSTKWSGIWHAVNTALAEDTDARLRHLRQMALNTRGTKWQPWWLDYIRPPNMHKVAAADGIGLPLSWGLWLW